MASSATQSSPRQGTAQELHSTKRSWDYARQSCVASEPHEKSEHCSVCSLLAGHHERHSFDEQRCELPASARHPFLCLAMIHWPLDQTTHVLGFFEVRDECVVLCGPVWLLLAACNPKYGEGSATVANDPQTQNPSRNSRPQRRPRLRFETRRLPLELKTLPLELKRLPLDIDVVAPPCRSSPGYADVQPRRFHRRARPLNFGNLIRRTIVLLRVAPLLEFLPRESGPLRQIATLATPQ